MKQTINTIYHGLGYLMICIGFIIIIGAGGNSDLGMELSMVGRYGISGLLTLLCGALLVWWRV